MARLAAGRAPRGLLRAELDAVADAALPRVAALRRRLGAEVRGGEGPGLR